MADDGYSRAYRVNDPYRRGGSAAASAPSNDDDPLAELARLIGQGDAAANWPAPSAPADANFDGYDHSGAYPNDQHAYPNDQHAYPNDQHYDGQYDQHYDARRYEAQHYADQGYADSHFQNNAYQRGEYQGGYDQSGFQQPGFQQPGYQPHHDHDRDGHHDHDIYEDARPSRRGGLMTVVVVFSFAVIGTAGAFTYRNFISGSGSKQVPVVLADPTPVKVVPDNSGRPADLPDLRQAERVTPREEQPLNLPGLGPTSPPAAFPSPAPPPVAQPVSPVTQSAPPGEPRRVRTVIITPSTPPDSVGQPGGSRAAQGGPGSTRWGNAKPAPTEPSGDAPLSLSPETAEPTPQRPMRTASKSTTVIPQSVAPGAAPTVAAGSFTVQLSAQKSEEDAQTTFRALQAKYPSLLEGREPIIRKKDLPSGTFYGVQVGPFAHDDAVQFCETIKSAHGDCMLQKN
jgi:hypothetical protein